MAGQRNDLLHAWILPDDDLVLTVSVGRDDLVAVLGPGEAADLATGIKTVDQICRRCGREGNVGG